MGEDKPRLQNVMCDLPYTSYKNKMLRVGIVGVRPYFAFEEQKIDGVDVKLLKFLAEKKSFLPKIIIPKTFVASLDAVCMRYLIKQHFLTSFG